MRFLYGQTVNYLKTEILRFQSHANLLRLSSLKGWVCGSAFFASRYLVPTSQMGYIPPLGVENKDLIKVHLPQDESLELPYKTPSVRFSATYLALATHLLLAELQLNLQNRIPLDFVFSGILRANVPISPAGYRLLSAVFSALWRFHLSSIW